MEGKDCSDIVAVVGLGYVGLPVAVAFSKKYSVIGFDTNLERISELQKGIDRTNELSHEEVTSLDMLLTSDYSLMEQANVFIITVPTPIDSNKKPDLSLLKSASQMVGQVLRKGALVVYESTVYPGTTEEICAPIIASVSGLRAGVDFFVAYSPERINPGDKTHSFRNINKVVSAQTEPMQQKVQALYGAVIDAEIHLAPSIKVAEAAKVIENTQRDVNIALMNELAIIFERMDINTKDVLQAARTKWNFLDFEPGLVGGHCIGVDPFYLTYKAEQLGYHPEVILSGRRINDDLPKYIVGEVIKRVVRSGKSLCLPHVAVLGATFKEKCPDCRNSKALSLVREFQDFGVNVSVCDPWADQDVVKSECQLDLVSWDDLANVDVVVLAVAHPEFAELSAEQLKKKLPASNWVIDIKRVWDKAELERAGYHVWQL